MKKILKGFIISAIMGIMLLSVSVVFADTTNDWGVVGTVNLGGTAQNSAKVEDVLTNPEIGWTRYNYSNTQISYFPTTGWGYDVAGVAYYHTYGTSNIKISFNFTGTKIRINGMIWNNCSNDIDVKIDGKIVGKYLMYDNGKCIPGPVLSYENLGLTNGEHSVELINNTSAYIEINSIDTDTNGTLKTYNTLPTTSILLNKYTDNLQVGQTDKLTATTTPAGIGVTWTSSDSNIATVDSNGVVAAIAVGNTTITATTADGLTTICTVTVTNSGNVTQTNTIVNIAHAKGDNTNNAGGEVSIIFNGVPDTTLSVVKTADVKSVWVGDTFTYTIVVKNTGSKAAKSVVINDSAPNHIQFMPGGITTTQGTVDSSSTSSNIVVNVGDIPPSGTVTITVPATVVF